MAGKAILTSRPNSHPFQDRTLTLDQPAKIGRSVAKARAAPVNAIFDCKVLSRNHALIWYSHGKFFLQDTKSSNGTFVNNQRLSKSGEESSPREVSSGDIVQFGVDVLETSRKVTHGCIVANLKLYLPDGKEAKASDSTSVISSNFVPVEDLYELHKYIQEAVQREQLLETKLRILQEVLRNIGESAEQGWKALIAEDRLLTRVEALENQLQIYSKNFGEDKLKEELRKLQDEKNQYQNTAKGFLKKVLDEKLEAVQKCQEVKRSLLNVELQYNAISEDLSKSRNHIQELAQKLSAQITRNEETEAKLAKIEEQHKENALKLKRRNHELEDMLVEQKAFEASLEKQLMELRAAESRINEKDFKLGPKPIEHVNCRDKENRSSVISDDYNQSKSIADEETKSEEIELITAQLNLLESEKITTLKQINEIQDKYEELVSRNQEIDEEIFSLEDRISDLEQFDLDDDSSDNGCCEKALESTDELMDLRIKLSDLKIRRTTSEINTQRLKEELDQAKEQLSQISGSCIVTQEKLEKAQKEFEECRSRRMADQEKMSSEYANGNENDNSQTDNFQNNINRKCLDETQALKKCLVEAQQSVKQSRNEAALLADRVNSLTQELESRTYDNKTLDQLREVNIELTKTKQELKRLEAQNGCLKDECAKFQLLNSRESLSIGVQTTGMLDAELFNKLASLEENLVTMGTKYMECNDERSKLSQQLASLKLDYQAISHQKYFNCLFALPCVLLVFLATIAFYPTLSFLLGTADLPDEL